MNQQHTVRMTLERETKGALRYAADTSDPLYLIDTLYLRKAGAQTKLDGQPQEIWITIQTAAPEED